MEQLVANATQWLIPTAVGTPSLDLNWTLAVQLTMFVLTWIGLNILVFQPYLKARSKRTQLTEGHRQEAANLEAEAEQVLSTYEAKIQDVKARAALQRDATVREGSEQGSTLVGSARSDAAALRQKERAEIEKQMAEARSALKPQAQELSDAIATKILAA